MTRQMRFKAFVVAALLSLLSNNSPAAVIAVWPELVGFLDPITFNPVPLGTSGVPVVFHVDVKMRVVSLEPSEDSFGYANFSFRIKTKNTPGTFVPDLEAGGWAANPLPQVDSNGTAPGGIMPVFATNADLGPSSQDYQGIQVRMANGPFTNAVDPRRNVGEIGSSLGVPILLGSAFFEWNGRGAFSLRLDPVEVAAKRTDGSFVIAQAIPNQKIALPIPEPSSVVLLVGCLVGVVLRRRAA